MSLITYNQNIKHHCYHILTSYDLRFHANETDAGATQAIQDALTDNTVQVEARGRVDWHAEAKKEGNENKRRRGNMDDEEGGGMDEWEALGEQEAARIAKSCHRHRTMRRKTKMQAKKRYPKEEQCG